MKASEKIKAALSARVEAYNALKGTSETEGSVYVQGSGTFHEPGSLNRNKGSGDRSVRSRRVKRTAPQGGGSPSRVARRQGTKAATVQATRGATRGAVQKARRAIRVPSRVVGTGDGF